MISHQRAKALANDHLRRAGSDLVAAGASRVHGLAWCVGYEDPDRPGELLEGGALLVTDDEVVHSIGSLPNDSFRLLIDLGYLRLDEPSDGRSS